MTRDHWPDAAFAKPLKGVTFDDIERDPTLLTALANQAKLESRKAANVQVEALLAAGWKFELPAIEDSEPWQWYWRRPPRRKKSEGMFFLSTQQAYNSLIRGD